MEAADMNVVALPEEPRRIRRRMLLATAARQRLDEATPPRRARAWINGREAGGQDPRFAHLSRVHD
jgi:hypothetical protein